MDLSTLQKFWNIEKVSELEAELAEVNSELQELSTFDEQAASVKREQLRKNLLDLEKTRPPKPQSYFQPFAQDAYVYPRSEGEAWRPWLAYLDKKHKLESELHAQTWPSEKKRRLTAKKRELEEKIAIRRVAPTPNTLAKPAQQPAAGQELFTHSSDFSNVSIRSTKFTLTPNQSRVIQHLAEQYKKGTPSVSQAFIAEEILLNNSDNFRLRDAFKSTPGSYKALIKEGAKKGHVRLNLP